jgi:hypothetical protein
VVGVKGRSGRASTPEARQRRAISGAKGGRAKVKATEPAVVQKVDLSVTKLHTLKDHDRRLGLPVSWGDSIKRQQVIGEQLANEEKRIIIDGRRIEADKIRAKLFTREQVEDRERQHSEIIFQQFSKMAEFVASLVPAEMKEDARKKAKSFVSEVREAVANAVKAARDG